MAVPPYQLKQKPTDTWSIREKLALASSVERTRDQNWVSVSRQIKPFAETNRPQDWFSQKNCALQYGALLEDVEHPKRKRGEEIATPGSIIVKNLVQERIQELEQLLKDGREKHEKLQKELAQLKDEQTDDQTIEAMVDAANKDVENEVRQGEEYEQWLKARELEAERQRQVRLQMLAMKTKKQVRTISDASDSVHSDDSNLIAAPESPLPPPPSSLLTTLLRSPTQSPNQSPRTSHGSLQLGAPQSVSVQRLSTESQHSGSNTPALTPPVPTSIQAPTLSKLLEQPLPTPSAAGASTPRAADDASQVKLQFETVKQEVSVEDSVKREPTFQETLSAIEDVTNRLQEPQHIPPLDPSIARAVEAVPEVDVGDENIISVIEQLQEDMQRKEEEEQQRKQLMAMQQLQEVGSVAVPDPNTPAIAQSESQQPPPIGETVPFKSFEPAANTVKTVSLKQASPEPASSSDAAKTQQVLVQQKQAYEVTQTNVQMSSDIQPAQSEQQEQQPQPKTQTEAHQQALPQELGKQPKQEPLPQVQDPPVQAFPQIQQQQQQPSQQQQQQQPQQQQQQQQQAQQQQQYRQEEQVPLNTPMKVEQISSDQAHQEQQHPKSQVAIQHQVVSTPKQTVSKSEEIKTEKEEQSPALEAETPERTDTSKSGHPAFTTEEASGQDCQDAPIYEEHVSSNAEVDSDPFSQNAKDSLPEQDEMIEEEVSEEEIAQDQEQELDIKNTAGLESQAAVPAVKATKEPTPDKERDVDRERDQKIWKKSALLVWRTAANHSNANVFMNPVPEDMAPGYDDIVFKPMDLTTIRRNIENGVIKTTMELLRDMMLMFQNAIMYNSADHDVYHMAIEMQDDVVKQIEELMANEASERSGGSHPPEGVKRPARHRHSDSDISSKKPRRSTGFGFK